MKIAVISDTHDMLRPELLAQLAGCDRILHAGDVVDQIVLDRLRAVAPTVAVLGNNDEWYGMKYPHIYKETIGGLAVVMAHKLENALRAGPADIVITGHTHRYAEKTENGCLYLNPGSCGTMRCMHMQATYAFLHITDGKVTVEKRMLSAP